MASHCCIQYWYRMWTCNEGTRSFVLPYLILLYWSKAGCNPLMEHFHWYFPKEYHWKQSIFTQVWNRDWRYGLSERTKVFSTLHISDLLIPQWQALKDFHIIVRWSPILQWIQKGIKISIYQIHQNGPMEPRPHWIIQDLLIYVS
jgi:hypothetical protein